MHWEFLPNGEVRPETPDNSAGSLLCGYSVYTTFRWPLPHRWWIAHIERLSSNARALALDWPFREADLRNAITQIAQPERPILRLTAFASPDSYGELFQNAPLPVRLWLNARPMPQSPIVPLNLKTEIYKRPLPLIKQGSMVESIHLKREAQVEGIDDVLFTSKAGTIRETSTANIFGILDGKLHTPSPERDGCLPGITRLQVQALAETLGIPYSESQAIFTTELLQADGAFLTNAVQGIIPVAGINGKQLAWIPQASAILETLQARLWL
jgi:branched-subunit amino acid aminotransferase/4-amino-4-deoxychorismate lyase